MEFHLCIRLCVYPLLTAHSSVCAAVNHQFNKGNLFIKLNVKFPKLEDLQPEVLEQLAKILPPSPAVDTSEEVSPPPHALLPCMLSCVSSCCRCLSRGQGLRQRVGASWHWVVFGVEGWKCGREIARDMCGCLSAVAADGEEMCVCVNV